MNTITNAILGMLAETFIHPGAGQSGGAIDLPVAREAATSYPFIAGSSFKGALRDAVDNSKHNGSKSDENSGNAEDSSGNAEGTVWDRVFGEEKRAGELLVSDVRLLLLPVRSLTSAYCWVTCPHLLERLARDIRRAGIACAPQTPPSVEAGRFMRIENSESNHYETLYLEERGFGAEPCSDSLSEWVGTVQRLIADSSARKRLAKQLVLLCDDDFAWFAKNGLAVHARNVLNKNKKSDNLWYEETLPPDTVMYSILSERNSGSDAISSIREALPSNAYLQIGGNETIGQGWFLLEWLKAKQ